MEPAKNQQVAEEPSRVLRGVAALRAAPVGKRRAYAAIGAALATLVFVGGVVGLAALRGADAGEGVWGAGAAQLIGAFDGLLESAKFKSEL